VPNSNQAVVISNGVIARSLGSSAAAYSVVVGGASGTSTLGIDTAGNALAVATDLTLAPGAGVGHLRFVATNTSLTLNGGSGSILRGAGSGEARLEFRGGFAGSLGLSSATVDNLLLAGTTTGELTITNGQTYNVSDAVRVTTATSAGATGVLNVAGGVLNMGGASPAGTVTGELVLNSGTNAANTATVNLSGGGSIVAKAIRRDNAGAGAAINWADGTIGTRSDNGLTLSSSAGAGTLDIFLAGTGTHTFNAQSNRTITVESTAVLANKTGEQGTLTKTGAGTLDIRSVSTYTGGTTISAGELTLSTAGALSTATALDLAGATARFDIASMTAAGSTNGSLAGVAGSVVNLGAKNLNVGGNNASTTFAGIMTNAGSLTKSGAGTLTLSGANTYSGGTLIGAGTLRLSDGGAVAGAITNNAILAFDRSDAATVSGAIGGTGLLAKAGAGTVTLSASNSYSGGTTINAGTVLVNNNAALGSGAVTMNTGTTLSTATSAARSLANNLVIAGDVSFNQTSGGTGQLNLNATRIDLGEVNRRLTINTLAAVAQDNALVTTAGYTKDGTGRLNFSGSQNYSGSTILEAGTLSAGRDAAFGTSTLVLRGGTLAGSSSVDRTFANAVNIEGDVVLTEAVDRTGAITLSGAVNLGNAARTLTINTAATLSGVVGGTGGGLTKNGNGTLTLSGQNTYTGLTTVTNGTLKLGSSTALGNTAGATAVGSGGLLDLNGQTGVAEALNYTDTGGLLNSAAGAATVSGTVGIGSGMTVNTTGDITLSGQLAGDSSKNLTKSGAGTLKFTAANSTFAGTSTVSAGTLLVDTGASVASSTSIVNGGLLRVNGTAGSVTVNGGGSLSGSGSVGALSLNSGGLLNPGNSPGALTANSAIVLGNSTYNWQITSLTGTAGTNWDLLNVTTLLDMSAITGTGANKWNLVVTADGAFTGWTGTSEYSYVFAQAASVSGFSATAGTDVTSLFNITTSGITGLPNSSYNSSGDFKVVVGRAGDLTTLKLMAIPEPSTGSLLGFGFAGLVVTRLLRRRSSR
jgi:autotransporter-associated beta strand protein